MYALHALVERWGALVTAIVLLGLPVAGWSFGRSFSSIDIVVGGVGIGALLVAVDDFVRRREPTCHGACPHCGEPLPECA
jgi:hypothetical protein